MLHRRLRLPLLLTLLAASALGSTACGPDSEAPPPFETAVSLQGRLEADTGVRWLVTGAGMSTEPRFVAPLTPVSLGNGTPESEARAFFAKYATELHADKGADLGPAEIIGGDLTTVRFDHTLAGTKIPIRGASSGATFLPDGKVLYVEPSFSADIASVPKSAALAVDRATALAREYLDITCGGSATDGVSAPELVVETGYGPSHLEYRIKDSTFGESCAAPTVRIDATTGKVLGHDSSVRYADSVTVGGTRHYAFSEAKDVKPVSYYQQGGSYVLGSDKVEIIQENPVPGSLPAAMPVQTKSLTEWEKDIRRPAGRGSAIDALFHLEITMAIFAQEPFSRLGLANDGRKTRVIVHDTHEKADVGAMYVPYGLDKFTLTDAIYVGDGPAAHGKGQRTSYAAALDLMAHEYTHGIVAHTARLADSDQIAAVEEGFCDIMGAAVEHASRPSGLYNWQTGEDVSQSKLPMRSLDAPSSVPGAHGADYWTADAGDPHALGGVGTRAFSFAVKGGIDKQNKVNIRGGIGWESAAKMWFESVTRSRYATIFPLIALEQILKAASDATPPRAAAPDPKHAKYAALRSIVCGWQAVGLGAPGAVYNINCEPVYEGSAAPLSGSTCAGTTGTAYVCQEEAPYAAYVCKDGAIAGGIACIKEGALCKHPSADDFSATVVDGALQCE